METPVLLIHFSRPDYTRRQIEALKAIQPKRIWALCDGARKARTGEAERVTEVRHLLSELPWECELTTLFRDENLGVYANISSGLSWFFAQCEQGIILEDDCLPDASFFRYATEMLERYADEEKVFSISGYTGQNEDLQINDSYCFSNYFSCWGWATWRRAWECFEPEMNGFVEPLAWQSITGRLHPNLRQRMYWRMIFNRVVSGKTDSWAYRFLLSMWHHQGLALTPRRNLIENIGFSDEATNTAALSERETKALEIDFPLRHPTNIESNQAIDRWIEDNCHSKNLPIRLKWLMSRFRAQFRQTDNRWSSI